MVGATLSGRPGRDGSSESTSASMRSVDLGLEATFHVAWAGRSPAPTKSSESRRRRWRSARSLGVVGATFQVARAGRSPARTKSPESTSSAMPIREVLRLVGATLQVDAGRAEPGPYEIVGGTSAAIRSASACAVGAACTTIFGTETTPTPYTAAVERRERRHVPPGRRVSRRSRPGSGRIGVGVWRATASGRPYEETASNANGRIGSAARVRAPPGLGRSCRSE